MTQHLQAGYLSKATLQCHRNTYDEWRYATPADYHSVITLNSKASPHKLILLRVSIAKVVSQPLTLADYFISWLSEDHGNPNVRTRKTAICARVTGSSGQ
jgi:hypothetical protein